MRDDTPQQEVFYHLQLLEPSLLHFADVLDGNAFVFLDDQLFFLTLSYMGLQANIVVSRLMHLSPLTPLLERLLVKSCVLQIEASRHLLFFFVAPAQAGAQRLSSA